MKKLIAFVMIFIVLVCFAFEANAEQKTSDSIHFLGMNWLITEKEFEAVLTGKGFIFEKNFGYPEESYWFEFDGINRKLYTVATPKILQLRLNYYPPKVNGSTYQQYICKVAGYNVGDISAEYLPSYDKNRLYIGEPYRLVRAKYSIDDYDLPDNVAPADAYDDLRNKLTRLYGEPIVLKEKPEKMSDSVQAQCAWIKEDGTGLSLTHRYISITGTRGWHIIDIEYGFADDSAYVNDILDILEMRKQKAIDDNSNNMDGL